MKKLYFILLLTLLSASTYSQTVTESIISIKEGYQTGNLFIEYTRTFNMGSADTTFNVLVKLTNKETQIESVSLGSSLFGGGGLGMFGGGGLGISMKSVVNIDHIVLNSTQFFQFYEGINKVFTFLLDKQRFKDNGLNTVAVCSVESLVVGGEYNPKALEKLVFYFKIGDKSFYKATFDEYRKTVLQIAQINADLKNRISKQPVKQNILTNSN